MFFTVLLVVTLAWGAFAIGAVYPWGYVPLAAACAIVGCVALFRREAQAPKTHRRANVPLLVGVALVAAVILAQLVPLPKAVLQRLSPGTVAFLEKNDLQYRALEQTLAVRGQAGPRADSLPLAPRAQGSAGSGASIRHPISIDPPKTWLGLGLFSAFALLLVGLVRGLTARDARRLAAALVAVGVVLALVGVVTRATWGGRIYGLWQPYASDALPFGPFVNRNHFAGWMVMALSLGVGYFLGLLSRGMAGVKPGWHHRLLWFASTSANRLILVAFGLLVMAVALVVTLSRSGITCFTIALLLSGIVAIRHEARRSKRALASSYLALVFVLAVGWVGMDTVATRFERLGSDYAQRTEIWADTLAVFRDFPVFGCGIDTLGTAMFVYQTSDPASHIVEAHNDYLQLGAEGGVAMVFAALLFTALFVRQVRRRFRDDTPDEMTYWIRVGAVTGLVAIALQEIVEFSLQMPGDAALFAVLAAISAGRMGHREKRLKAQGSGPDQAEGYGLRATGLTGAEG